MKKLIGIFCFLLMTAVVQAQETLKLDDAINIALKNSLDVQFARNVVEQNTINNHIGVAGGLPLVTGNIVDNESVTSVNQKLNTGMDIQRNNAAANNLSANVTGSILLYNGGRVIATKKRLSELVSLSNQQLNSQIQNIIASVMTGYYDIIRQQNYIRTIDSSIAASNQQLTIVKARQSVGLANNADLFQAQIDLNVLQQSKLAQELIVSQAKAELLRLLTLKADSSITITDTILVDKNVRLEDIQSSLVKNADIQAAEAQIRINRQIVKEVGALRYPSIRATTGYNFTRNQAAAGNLLLNQNYGPTVGVTLGIPIYNGSAFRRQQKVAEIDVLNAGLQKDILVRDYSAEVVKQFQAYTNTINQLDSAMQNYKLSEQLLKLTLLRFQFRQATIVEVKNAQQSFEESGFRLVNLNFVAKSSEIELKRLANILVP